MAELNLEVLEVVIGRVSSKHKDDYRLATSFVVKTKSRGDLLLEKNCIVVFKEGQVEIYSKGFLKRKLKTSIPADEIVVTP
jgi:hypothetical protein